LPESRPNHLTWRLLLLAGLISAAMVALVVRLALIQIVNHDRYAEEAAVALHAAAAWIPARLTAALFGLAGSLDQALKRWQELRASVLASWRERVWATLAEVSAASLTTEDGEAGPVVPATLEAALREVLAMQQRALLILLAAFGLFSAGGWIT